jgi:AcrR family transcriptional regulator
MNQKARQKAATRQALIEGLEVQLAQGVQLSVEGIAARAGVNKALLYRYFGGLPGLIGAFAAGAQFMPDEQELLAYCGSNLAKLPPRERFVQCMLAYVRALERRPAAVQILLRMHSLDADALAAIAAGRQRAVEVLQRLFADLTDEMGFDVELCFNLLLGGICQLLATGRRNWVDDPKEADRLGTRIGAAIRGMIVAPHT